MWTIHTEPYCVEISVDFLASLLFVPEGENSLCHDGATVNIAPHKHLSTFADTVWCAQFSNQRVKIVILICSISTIKTCFHKLLSG